MTTQIFQLPLKYCASSFSSTGQRNYGASSSPSPIVICKSNGISDGLWVKRRKNNRRFGSLIVKQEKGDVTEIRVPVPLTLEQQEKEKQNRDDEEDEIDEGDVDPEDLKYVNEIKRVIELLRRNRDMIFSEVKLTIMIEDPRELERRRLLGIEDADTPSRDDLAEALEQVNDGKIPKDRATLRMLHEEMIRWPNLEVEVSKKQRGKSMYAKSTDTGIDPKEAAKRLNVEWDSAAAIEEVDVDDEQGVVTKVAGYGALYFVSALPVIIDRDFRSENKMVAAVLMPTISFRDESAREDWQVLSRNDSKKKILVKQTSMMQSEREISMDPKSIRSLSMSGSLRRNDSFDMVRLPAMSPPRDLDSPMPLPLQPVQTTGSPKQRSGLMRALRNREQDSLPNSPKQRSGLMRAFRNKDQDSLPNSTTGSPKQRSGLMRALRNKEQDSLPNSTTGSPKQRSGLMRALRNKEQDSSSASYKRSKSCGSTSKTLSHKSSGIRNSFFIKTDSNKSISNNSTLEDRFKCNALCLFLPGFSKGKPIRSSQKDDSSSFTRTTTMTRSSSSTITVSRTVSVRESTTTTTVISARASMEKFDCGSYTSESCGEEGGNHFFDLPSELIKSGSGDNDHDEPVSAAFVFDKEPVEKEIKGVLKVSGSKNRKAMESPSLRQVRFSTSSPVSYPTSPAISPRLLEATKNFNAFLEAQAV